MPDGRKSFTDKKEFLRENGVLNDTTKRSDVFTNLYRKMQKNDRLTAGHTLHNMRVHTDRLFMMRQKQQIRLGNLVSLSNTELWTTSHVRT